MTPAERRRQALRDAGKCPVHGHPIEGGCKACNADRAVRKVREAGTVLTFDNFDKDQQARGSW